MRRAKYVAPYAGSTNVYADLARERIYSAYLVKALQLIAGPMPFNVTEQADLNRQYACELGARMQIAQKALRGEMFLPPPAEPKPRKEPAEVPTIAGDEANK